DGAKPAAPATEPGGPAAGRVAAPARELP
ncbi:MAG: hypothetical protein QOE11_1664, partial [Solirubrobacteraceae bacterium]|nr:hypothetical protein [Solirubrobacteraceae bacterium]